MSKILNDPHQNMLTILYEGVRPPAVPLTWTPFVSLPAQHLPHFTGCQGISRIGGGLDFSPAICDNRQYVKD